MKKVISILLAVAMLCCFMVTTAFAADASIYATSVSGHKDGTVNVNINVKNIDAIKSGKITINFDPAVVEYISTTRGLFSNGSTNENNVASGKLIVNHASETPIEGDGTLFTVTFKVIGSCESSSEISVTVNSLYAPDNSEITVSGTAGTVASVHNWVAGTAVAATCTTDGYTPYTCSVCGEVENRDIVKGGHTPEVIPAVPATCTKAGLTEGSKCSVCGEILVAQEETALAAHTPGETVIENATKAICEEGGSYDEVVYCSVCGAELSRNTVTVPAKGHTPGEAVRENEVPATCKEAGSYDEVVYCSVCKKELSREKKTIDKLTTHTPGEPVRENVKEATCKETGSYDEVIYCSVCGEELSRETKTIELAEHTPGKPVIENKVEATCSKAGSYEEVVYCSVCGEQLSRVKQTTEKLPHVDKDDDGKCDNCGEDMDDDEPKNGDITPYPVFFLAAMMAVMATAYGLKRKFSV